MIRFSYNRAMMSEILPEALKATLSDYFSRPIPGLVCAYLFGSLARGESRPRSDVDIGLLFKAPPTPVLGGQPDKIAADLERLLARPVDLVVVNDAPVDLVHRILRDGRLLCEHDRAMRVAFEVDARNRYFDLLPHLQRYREAVGA